jgi:hypothetical protein
MKVIGRTVAGAVIVEIDQQDVGPIVRLAEALVDVIPATLPPAPATAPATAPQPKRKYAKRSDPTFPGGPVPKAAAKPADKSVAKPTTPSGRTSTVTTKERHCAVCKRPYVPSGNAQKMCPICKEERLAELKRIADEQD